MFILNPFGIFDFINGQIITFHILEHCKSNKHSPGTRAECSLRLFRKPRFQILWDEWANCRNEMRYNSSRLKDVGTGRSRWKVSYWKFSLIFWTSLKKRNCDLWVILTATWQDFFYDILDIIFSCFLILNWNFWLENQYAESW